MGTEQCDQRMTVRQELHIHSPIFGCQWSQIHESQVSGVQKNNVKGNFAMNDTRALIYWWHVLQLLKIFIVVTGQFSKISCVLFTGSRYFFLTHSKKIKMHMCCLVSAPVLAHTWKEKLKIISPNPHPDSSIESIWSFMKSTDFNNVS